MRTIVRGALLLLLLTAPAQADTLYTYTGDTFRVVSGVYTTTDRIVGNLYVADSFVPERTANFQNLLPGVLQWSFSDGHQTLTELNSSGRVGLDVIGLYPAGPLLAWVVGFTALDGSGWLGTDQYGGPRGERSDNAGLGPPEASTSVAWNGFSIGGGDTGSTNGVWTVQHVSVPERAILPRLPRVLKFGLGLGLEAKVTRTLQRATAWLAAAILHAPREGVTILMPRVRVEVAEACSGLQTLLLMLGAAGLLVATCRNTRLHVFTCCGMFVVAAALLALEANALRVAGIAIGLEYLGAMTREGKDWIQIGTTGLAVAQLVVVGRWLR